MQPGASWGLQWGQDTGVGAEVAGRPAAPGAGLAGERLLGLRKREGPRLQAWKRTMGGGAEERCTVQGATP